MGWGRGQPDLILGMEADGPACVGKLEFDDP